VRIHDDPDLAMGHDLLTKTGSGIVVVVFSEPDVDLRTEADGRLVVEIRGLDVHTGAEDPYERLRKAFRTREWRRGVHRTGVH
jgi:hypothetical protein